MFAPELATEYEGYEPAHFAELASLEAQNFWFRARNQLILWALKTYFPNAQNFLEVGCGTGFVLSAIETHCPHLKTFGSEIFSSGLSIASQRLTRTQLLQMDARQIPFANEFDVIGAFDVLEHIEQDAIVLSQMRQAMRPSGGLILTVPQHPWLWSPADEFAHHVRRYRSEELRVKVEQAGFQVLRMTSFVSALLPLMLLSRLRQRQSHAQYNIMAELRIKGWVNTLLEKLLTWERGLIRLGLSFPLGGSLLIIATCK